MKSVWIFITLILVGACNSKRSAGPVPAPRSQERGAVQASEPVPIPPKLSLICAEGADCPAGVGALVYGDFKGSTSLLVCTAFLVSESTVMSNAHCDHLQDRPGYFVLPAEAGKDPRVIPLKSVERVNGTDVAVFTLSQPILEAPPLPLEFDAPAAVKSASVYVLNATAEKWQIEKRRCHFRRHEMYFPYELAESPTVLHGYDCGNDRGHSGAPLIFAGRQGASAVFMAFGRYDNHSYSTFANLRCYHLPGAAARDCQPVTAEITARRFDEAKDRAFMAASSSPYRYPLKSTLGAEEFEIVDHPACRQDAEFVFRKVRMDYDLWGAPSLTVLSEARAPLAVSTAPHASATVTASVTWPAPQGEYVSPEKDLRTQWPTTFSIDLPICSR